MSFFIRENFMRVTIENFPTVFGMKIPQNLNFPNVFNTGHFGSNPPPPTTKLGKMWSKDPKAFCKISF